MRISDWSSDVCSSDLNLDLAFALAGLRYVIAVLHPHEGVHRHAECLLDTQSHFRRQVRPLIEQGRTRGPRNAPHVRRRRDRQSLRLAELMLDDNAWVGRAFLPATYNRNPTHLPVDSQI